MTLVIWSFLIAGNLLCALGLLRTFCLDGEEAFKYKLCRAPAVWVLLGIYMVLYATISGFIHGVRQANPLLTVRVCIVETQRRIREVLFEEWHILTWQEDNQVRRRAVPMPRVDEEA